MTTAEKNAKISAMILTRVAAGESLAASMDAVLGAGTFEKVTGDIYTRLRNEPAAEPAAEPEVVKFETGVSYYCRSVCNWDCIWHFRIIRRTASSVWVKVNGEECRRGIRVVDGVEQFEPFGRYSMSPVVSANRRSVSVPAFAG